MATEAYKITVEGGGLNLSREVPKAVGDKIVLLVLTGEAGEGNLGEPRRLRDHSAVGEVSDSSVKAAEPRKATPQLSIREFLNENEPKRSPDKIAAIGIYLKDQEAKDTFTRQDLEKGFEDAAERVPGNLPRDINWAVKAGWIARKSGATGVYYVTHSGRDAVTKKFPREIVKKTSVDRPTRKFAKKAAAG